MKFKQKLYKDTLIGRNIIDKQEPDAPISIRDVVDKIPLRFSPKLHNINWDEIIDQTLPHINNHRKNTIRHASGKYSINPMLILSKLVQDQKDISTRLQSDEEFMLSTNSFANELSRYEHKFDVMGPKVEISRLEYSLRNALNMDEELINDFLATCDSILQRHDILAKTGISQPIDQRDISKRNEGETIVLELPYSNMECWQVSKFQNFFKNFLTPKNVPTRIFIYFLL